MKKKSWQYKKKEILREKQNRNSLYKKIIGDKKNPRSEIEIDTKHQKKQKKKYHQAYK